MQKQFARKVVSNNKTESVCVSAYKPSPMIVT